MMNRKRQITLRMLVEILIGTSGLPLWLALLVFFLGGIIVNEVSLFMDKYTFNGVSARWFVYTIFATLIFGSVIVTKLRSKKVVIEIVEKNPEPKAGLIIMVSTVNTSPMHRNEITQNDIDCLVKTINQTDLKKLTPEDFSDLTKTNLLPPLQALEFHYKSNELRECWLIATKDEDGIGSHDVPPVLEKWFRTLYPDCQITFNHGAEYCVGPRDYNALWKLVNRIFANSVYKSRKVIADVTSGTKLMSIGVALACLPEERTMQYMASISIDGKKSSDPDQLQPILVDINSYLDLGTSE
jgi:hypothetical protein